MNTKVTTLLLLLDGDKIMLAMKKRGFGEGNYNGVGGKVDPGETIEQAMVRETQEEIGVTPLKWEKVAVHDFSLVVKDVEPWQVITHTYICREWDGEPTESEEMAPYWFKLSEIPYDKMWDDDVIWLPAVLHGKKLRTTFSFNKNKQTRRVELVMVDDFNTDD